MILNNKYICLSKKDEIELKEWNRLKSKSKNKFKNNKTKKSKKSSLDIMADKLKGQSYSDFLKSEYWSIIRKRVLARDKVCVICKSNNNLQVHHDTYKNHFREHCHLADLMVLCRNCHKEVHYCT